jgi:predicted nucleic acid-binding protein
MKPTVYVETTVVSYLTARPHRDIIVSAHQQLTREWWEVAPDHFQTVVSDLVLLEASRGDSVAAADRLALLDPLPQIEITSEDRELARKLVEAGAIPAGSADDALHIAVAAANGCDFLVTWNFRHIANPTMKARIADVCRRAGYVSPVICTPEELKEGFDELD